MNFSNIFYNEEILMNKEKLIYIKTIEEIESSTSTDIYGILAMKGDGVIMYRHLKMHI